MKNSQNKSSWEAIEKKTFVYIKNTKALELLKVGGKIS